MFVYLSGKLTTNCTLGLISGRRSQISASMLNEFSWLLSFDVFNDCMLFALMRTSDVSKNLLSKCGSYGAFGAKRPLSDVRFDDADEHGKLMVAAFDLAVKCRKFSASGRSSTFESMRVTMNLRFAPVFTSVSSVLLQSIVGVSSLLLLLLLLLPLVKLLLTTSTLCMSLLPLLSSSSESSSLMVSGEFDSISLALLFIKTVFLKSPAPALAASMSDDTRYSKSDAGVERSVATVFSSISGSRRNLANLLVVSAVALAGGGIVMVSILSRSSIDAANSRSNSSWIIVVFFCKTVSHFFLLIHRKIRNNLFALLVACAQLYFSRCLFLFRFYDTIALNGNFYYLFVSVL